jgi:hypothetical protein
LILIGAISVEGIVQRDFAFLSGFDDPVYFWDEEASFRAVTPAPNQVNAVLHTQIDPYYISTVKSQFIL